MRSKLSIEMYVIRQEAAIAQPATMITDMNKTFHYLFKLMSGYQVLTMILFNGIFASYLRISVLIREITVNGKVIFSDYFTASPGGYCKNKCLFFPTEYPKVADFCYFCIITMRYS